jgi:hypothetical protein
MRNDQHQTCRPSPSPATFHVEQTWQGCVVPPASAQLFHFEWHLPRLGDGSRRSHFDRPASEAFLRDYKAAIDDLHFTCHALNRPMQRIAESAGARIEYEGCACFGEIDVAAERVPHELAR